MEGKVYLSFFMAVIYGMILPSNMCPKECACSDDRVDCYSRHLQIIPDDIPESVTSLDLHDNEIREVDAEKLSHLRKLEMLSFHTNHLTELKSLIFVNLTKLTKLQIANNDIETIDHNVFTNLPSLQDVDLTNNRISEIAGKLSIPSLQRLYLGLNQITSLQDNTLNGVRNLHYLILANNKIAYISKSAFDGMMHLSYLVLHGNPLKNVDHIFRDTKILSYLDISSCHLTNIPRGLPWALRYLKISDNNLTMVGSQDLQNTRYLAVLILDNNHIQVIQDGALSYTPYLTEFDISHNKMRWLPQIPKNIETFIADDNEIHRLFQFNFAHDSALKVLSLSKNKIGEIPPNTFARLSNLSTLFLGHNDIKDLKNMSFAGLRQLNALHLEFNPLEKIECRAFGGLQRLEQLKLANTVSNQTIIDGIIFQDVPSLSNLDLQGSPSIINEILNSSELLRSLRSIQHLNLINGSLEKLPMEIRTSLPNLKSLKLSANPWKCDAELVELHNWMNDSQKLFGDSKITCASPEHLTGRLIEDVSIKELTILAPTVSTFSTSYKPVNILNTTTISIKDLNETETTGHSRYTTGLAQLYAVTTTAEVIETKHLKVTALPAASDITTFVPELASPSASSEHVFTTEQKPILHSSVTSDQISTIKQSLMPLSIVTPLITSSSDQIFPSTAIPESSNISATLKPTPVVSLFPPLSSTLPTPNFNTATTGRLAWFRSSACMQITATRTSDVELSESSIYAVPDSSSRLSHATTSITEYTTKNTHPTSVIILQPINRITTSKSTIWPTSVTSTAHSSIILTDATLSYPQTRKPCPITTTKIPALSLLNSSLATSMTTLPITQSFSNSIKSKSAPTISTHDSIITAQSEIPQTPSVAETLTTSKLLHITSEPFVLTTSKMKTSKSRLPSTENAEVHDTTEKILEDQNDLTNNTGFERNNKGYPVKPPVKTDNRLPTLSSSADSKLKTIIITVSVSLFALVAGLFIAVAVVRYRKKRKHVSFDSKHTTELQTETSDTVVIISHMEGEQVDNVNNDTTREGAKSASSLKDNIRADNGLKQTRKGLKFKRQRLSASAVISKPKFDCIRGQTEDDSELLMYSWK